MSAHEGNEQHTVGRGCVRAEMHAHTLAFGLEGQALAGLRCKRFEIISPKCKIANVPSRTFFPQSLQTVTWHADLLVVD